MADPDVKNVNLLSELTDVAPGDTLIVNDASAIDDLADMTKQVRMDKIKLFSSSQITDGIVTLGKIAAGAVTSDNLYNGVVIYNQHLYNGCVGSTKLADGSVTANKINTAGINLSSQFASQVVNTAALKDLNVTTGKLADLSVTNAKLAAGAVTQAKLGAIKRMIMIPVFGLEDAVIVKNFTRIMAWHPGLNGHVVTGAWAALLGATSSSGTVSMNLVNGGNTMCSISLTAGTWSAQSGTINTSYDDVASLATFSVNVTASGTGAVGLTVYLEVTG